MKKDNDKINEQFSLYDLLVEVVGNPSTFVCSHTLGDSFKVLGENLVFDTTKSFSMYSLSALLPILPAKQRLTDPNDWMTTDTKIACPDPNCGAKFKITRLDKRNFNHSDVTKVPIKK